MNSLDIINNREHQLELNFNVAKARPLTPAQLSSVFSSDSRISLNQAQLICTRSYALSHMVRLGSRLRALTRAQVRSSSMALKSMHAESTEACVLRLVNKSARSINALWVDFTGEEKCYQSLEPGHARPQRESPSASSP